MKHIGFLTIKLLAAAALAVAAPLASAGGDVSWSISVGSPYPPAPVYAPPPVVYVQPQPVYVRPRPVYVQPAPVVYGPTYYVEEVRHRKHHHRKHRHHHHRYDY
ncbi:MAG TPA: hypothetical protein VEC01_01905 [Noviherbaspirillum sp.]|uniref:hypothetical protein n=1 Tax=Noviherbaspirillum sp. TaxID=1926288 RepID=UPI002D4B914B|nr:hypothetical protein [Noviherbaspirillum sp.]HYD94051.1 hypothetical protein [Noviherbaspirillum sp.]